jgi:FixJ family two-component response regulator
MATAAFTIFLIDDDTCVLKALTRLLQAAGYRTKAYSSSETFLHEHDASISGCAVLDLSMPVLNGLDAQQALMRQGADRPIIFLTGQGSIEMSVLAMRAGAVDVLVKPVNRSELLQAIKCSEERDKINRHAAAERRVIHELHEKLTRREREVLRHVIAGTINKQIAIALGVGEKTIKVHRGRIMKKMRARSMAALVRMTEKISLQPSRFENSLALRQPQKMGQRRRYRNLTVTVSEFPHFAHTKVRRS